MYFYLQYFNNNYYFNNIDTRVRPMHLGSKYSIPTSLGGQYYMGTQTHLLILLRFLLKKIINGQSVLTLLIITFI